MLPAARKWTLGTADGNENDRKGPGLRHQHKRALSVRRARISIHSFTNTRGTVLEGESTLFAACREFEEETGLIGRMGYRHLGDSHRPYERDGKVRNLHRTYFHLPLEDDLPKTWDHFENSPSGGGTPILFRFSGSTSLLHALNSSSYRAKCSSSYREDGK